MNASAESHSLDDLRAVYNRLDPTAPVRGKAQQEWYIQRPMSAATRVGRSLLLDPTDAHLIVGSIGCGKSSELFAVRRQLKSSPGISTFAAEVGDYFLTAAEPLPNLLVLRLLETYLRQLPADDQVSEILSSIESARSSGLFQPRGGYVEYLCLLEDECESNFSRWFRLAREASQLDGDVGQVWLIDGLDRIVDPAQFDALVTPLLMLLNATGIGVALVGPRRVLSGVDRLGVAEFFDERHLLRPIDPATEVGAAFFNSVLAARGVADMLPDEVVEELIVQSGGAVRILLQMTRDVIKDAWVRNVEHIGLDSVAVAADRMGRALLLGLTDADVRILREVLKTSEFGARAPEDMALVLTNRVLEYGTPQGLPRHVVHPTLVPFFRATDAV